MTITIDLKELETFEEKCHAWAREHCMAQGEVLIERGNPYQAKADVLQLKEVVRKYEAEHPLPTLIPRV